ncbi:hypothetical protein EG329_002271 [Mollisiaceae sp. DMI_Dod_QoI]|nr:hypothetical protein EG329_002271 [Helotiales sp. DMI_Dod_QoI]
MASVASTTLTVGGTPTVFLPLPTPWPSGLGCADNIYVHTPIGNPTTFLAWDPLFGASMMPTARSCLPPQVTSWWSQGAAANPYTALGPTFVCPEAYSAVQTVLVASSLQQIFCCPSQYSLLVPQPTKGGAFPSQCMSTVTEGQTMTFLSQQGEPDAFMATVIMNQTATAFGIPVNGFNLATTSSMFPSQTTTIPTTSEANTPASTTQPTSTGTASQPNRSTAPSTSLSPGASAGIAVGVVFVTLLLASAGYIAWKRRRKAKPISSTLLSFLFIRKPSCQKT